MRGEFSVLVILLLSAALVALSVVAQTTSMTPSLCCNNGRWAMIGGAYSTRASDCNNFGGVSCTSGSTSCKQGSQVTLRCGAKGAGCGWVEGEDCSRKGADWKCVSGACAKVAMAAPGKTSGPSVQRDSAIPAEGTLARKRWLESKGPRFCAAPSDCVLRYGPPTRLKRCETRGGTVFAVDYSHAYFCRANLCSSWATVAPGNADGHAEYYSAEGCDKNTETCTKGVCVKKAPAKTATKSKTGKAFALPEALGGVEVDIVGWLEVVLLAIAAGLLWRIRQSLHR